MKFDKYKDWTLLDVLREVGKIRRRGRKKKFKAGIAQSAEHTLGKGEVARSTRAASSKFVR